MQSRPMSINQIKRDKKKLLESYSATSLIDDYVAEIYDCKNLSAEDYVEIRGKFAKDSRHNLLLVRVKR